MHSEPIKVEMFKLNAHALIWYFAINNKSE